MENMVILAHFVHFFLKFWCELKPHNYKLKSKESKWEIYILEHLKKGIFLSLIASSHIISFLKYKQRKQMKEVIR